MYLEWLRGSNSKFSNPSMNAASFMPFSSESPVDSPERRSEKPDDRLPAYLGQRASCLPLWKFHDSSRLEARIPKQLGWLFSIFQTTSEKQRYNFQCPPTFLMTNLNVMRRRVGGLGRVRQLVFPGLCGGVHHKAARRTTLAADENPCGISLFCRIPASSGAFFLSAFQRFSISALPESPFPSAAPISPPPVLS